MDQASPPMPGSRATVTLDTPAGLPARADVVGEATPGVHAVADPARAGFVVSKAVGGAVVRNRVKRRLRHLMTEHIDRLPSGATIVVRAQPGAALSRYQEMALDLENALDAALRLGRRQ
nr:ribonuclease P protein component [Allorhizocola rhizosphaerae]